MIYTVTFNPAIDYVIHMDQPVEIGETNRSREESLFFGGKGVNVSLILGQLNMENRALGFLAGFTGAAIADGIQAQGVQGDFIFLPKGTSRINVKLKSEKETEINAQGPDIDKDSLDALFQQFSHFEDGDCLVLAGSIPKSLPNDIYEQILERLKEKNILAVVDATGDLLKKVLPYHPFLIKPNKAELGELFQTRVETSEEIVTYAKKLQEMGARNVLISLGGDGAMLVSEDGDILSIGVPTGKAINTVGSGDSMVAGFLTGYLQSNNYETALALGTACGSATAICQGLADRATIDAQLEKIHRGEFQ